VRVLPDECVDWRLIRDLDGPHEVETVRSMGWSGVRKATCLGSSPDGSILS